MLLPGALFIWLVAGLGAAASAEPVAHAELTALIQQQVSVLSEPGHLKPAGQVATLVDPIDDYSGFMCPPEQEGCQFQITGKINRTKTGRLNHLATHSRWIGWKHLSEGHHTNGAPSHKHLTGDVGVHFFTSAPLREWIILIIVCVVLCLLDGLVLRHSPDSFRWHIGVIMVWVAVAALYMWGVWARMGRTYGVEWVSGYILEWMLSMDNLFIFHLVFQTYKTPQAQIHKAVFVGIIGAVVMRLIFFMVVSTLLHAVGWFRWPFGAMLIWSGIEAVRGEDEDDGDLKDTRLVRFLSWCCGDRILDHYDEDGTSIILWDKVTGKLQLSLLFVVIFIVEFSDIIFALDSVSAKVAQIPNQYIAFSSSVMAMYGLRAMFFIVQDLVQMFDLLKYGLGIILVLIGVELMFGRWIHIGSGVECIIIVGIFVLCIIASHIQQRFFPEAEEAEEAEEKSEEARDSDGAEGPKDEKADGLKEEQPREPAPEDPLSDIHKRPEGDEVESSLKGESKAWTIQEGRRSTEEKGEGSIQRAQSQPAPANSES
mmetsp:Transcript_153242/g.372042  ORF Transcript_153242/g.372042 Transcript_153242/m.372042 type:complete len:540 (+) Transcript_153242:65-1684(+)